MNSLDRTKQRKVEAEKILTELQLIQKLNVGGNSFLVGAAAYDLIVTPDIDIETFCEVPEPQLIMSKLATLIQNKNVIELKYRDYTDTDFKGHYYKLVYLYNEVEWNIDMWLFANNRDGALSRDLVPFMRDNLTNETREAILDIKEALLKFNENYASIFVYQAVLEYGVRSIDDFLEWTKYHDTTIPFNWRPKVLNET